MHTAFCDHDRLAFNCTFCRWQAEQAEIRTRNAAWHAQQEDQRMREGGGDD